MHITRPTINEDTMLSKRGAETAAQFDIPWRFVPSENRYDRDTNPDGIISFATAENELVRKELEEFANKVHIPGPSFGYGYSTAGGKELPGVLAAHLNEYFDPHVPLTGAEILCTASATALHEVLAFSLADAGDGILVTRPVYGRFELDFGVKARLEVVYADTTAERCFDEDVVEKLEEAMTSSTRGGVRVRAVLAVNPSNPLGRCYPRETLIALMKFCQRHTIHLISDEVYALSVFQPSDDKPDNAKKYPFTSVLSIDNTNGKLIDPRLLHVTYAMSKDFAAPGLRIGALITRSGELRRALMGMVRFHSPSGPAVAIAIAMLEDREWCRGFVELSRRRIAAAQALVIRRLGEIGVRHLPGSNAGVFLWLDLSPHLPPTTWSPGGGSCSASSESGPPLLSDREREFALAQRLVDGRVFLQPGEEHALVPGWFRMVYAFDEVTVLEGLRRLAVVIQKPWS